MPQFSQMYFSAASPLKRTCFPPWLRGQVLRSSVLASGYLAPQSRQKTLALADSVTLGEGGCADKVTPAHARAAKAVETRSNGCFFIVCRIGSFFLSRGISGSALTRTGRMSSPPPRMGVGSSRSLRNGPCHDAHRFRPAWSSSRSSFGDS